MHFEWATTSDNVHIEFVELVSTCNSLFVLKEVITCRLYPCDIVWGLYHGKFFNVGIYISYSLSSKEHGVGYE